MTARGMNPDAAARSTAQTIAMRTWFEIKTSWTAIVLPGAAAFALNILLPVQNVWTAAATAGLFAAAFVVCIAIGDVRRRHDPASAPPDLNAPRDVVVEQSSTVEQFGHAFARVALALGSFAAGVYAAGLFGF